MGPLCQRHIDVGMEKAGIWFQDDKVYITQGILVPTLINFIAMKSGNPIKRMEQLMGPTQKKIVWQRLNQKQKKNILSTV